MRKVGATRVSVDSLGAVFSQFSDQSIVRRELFRIASALKAMGVTAILTAERTDDYGPIARYGVEEFIADNVMILRNVLEDENRRRTIEILKFRGTDHQKGEYPFTIVPDGGRGRDSALGDASEQKSSDVRISSGNAELDDDVRRRILPRLGDPRVGRHRHGQDAHGHPVSPGRRGRGRALSAARVRGEPRAALPQRASAGASTSSRWNATGSLRVVCDYPDVTGLEDWLITHPDDDREFKPAARRARQSLGARARGTNKAFREFVIGLTSFIKHEEITGLFTSTTAIAHGRRLDHRDAHLDAHRLDHPAALRRDVRRDEARA